ncbi:MAG: S9 family peptidase [Anaerolineae bacterium]
MFRIESLLTARLFLVPQLVGDRLYFISNLSGHMSLYVMDYGGSVPEPLLPPDVVLQNPKLMNGYSYYVFPAQGKIVLMLDHHGDENYQPMVIPLDGGVPEPAFGDAFEGCRVHLGECDRERGVLHLLAESRTEQMNTAYQANLATGELTRMGESPWGCYVDGTSEDHSKAILIDGYTAGDHVLYLWERGAGDRRLLFGTPLEARAPGQMIVPNGAGGTQFVRDDRGLLLITTLFEDVGSLCYLDIANAADLKQVTLSGAVHQGSGEFEVLEKLKDDRYLLGFNIDGCSWLYEGVFDEDALEMKLGAVICGQGELAGGVLEAHHYDKETDRFVLAFSSATSPVQLYTVEGPDRRIVRRHTRERILGIPADALSPGEDASYTSFDGLRVSARLYLPAAGLGYKEPYPLVYYVHGGPQSQERPDFTWFSLPLIQFLTLNGFAVFVPNVRGSTGYGLSYMKKVDRDWGGDDRLDHVHAMTRVLPADPRIDTRRAGVVGRSYGGYMTLTLAARHPELWKAAVDMFGPYDLLTFMERIPETWKPYFRIAVGDPETDRDFLIERSPRTYMHQLACPMLVIQGKNDPRVVEPESRDLVEHLRAAGKQVDYLMFEDEGHDVLKFENRVTCYNAITDFFKRHL